MYIHFLISEKNKTEILELKRKLQVKDSHITHSTRLFLNENIPFPEQEKELKSFDRKWNTQEKTTFIVLVRFVYPSRYVCLTGKRFAIENRVKKKYERKSKEKQLTCSTE